MSTNKRFPLQVVPISLILLLVAGAGIYWFFTKGDGEGTLLKKPLDGDTLKIFRVPGGTLSTSGLTKTEMLSKSDKSEWLGTTSSVMRVDAIRPQSSTKGGSSSSSVSTAG